jgi:hypothetical protein
LELTDVSDIRIASIIRVMTLITLMVDAVRISETSVYSNKTTRHYDPKGSLIFTIAAVRI